MWKKQIRSKNDMTAHFSAVVLAICTPGYACAGCPLQHDNNTATPPQWTTLQPQHLTPRSEQLLSLLEDAESCLPNEDSSELKARERIMLSDLLKCSKEPNTDDIAVAAREFARRHKQPDVLLSFLEPLVYAQPGGEHMRSFGPWINTGGKLVLGEQWNRGLFLGGTGPGFHFRILEQPAPKGPRAVIISYEKQIVNELSRWPIPPNGHG